jgi:DNA modification methylase
MTRKFRSSKVVQRQKTLSGKLSVRYVPVDTVRPDPNNPRIHTEKQVKQIAKSISTFGFNVPILVDGDLNLIAGHGRWFASKLLGLAEVPIITLEHLTDQQRRAYVIADNRLSETAEWNEKLLGEQLKILSEAELDFTLEAIGFEMAEIDLIIENLAPSPDGQSNPGDALPEMPVGIQISQEGDLWLLGRHRVYCGNSLSESSYTALMGNAKATMVFSDPPYNVLIDGHASGLGTIRHKSFQMAAGEMNEAEFTDFLSRICNLLAAHSIEGSLHFLCVDWKHLGELLAAGKQSYGELKNVCIWVKDHASIGSLYRNQHEIVLVFKHAKESHHNKVQNGHYGRYRSNVWNYPGVNSLSRSADECNLLALRLDLKPVALVADAIMDCSMRGDLVLDASLGGGTTIIASEITGRKCYGIELDPSYVDTIVRRWEGFTGLSAVHGISGKTFADYEKEIRDGHDRQ